LAQVDRSLPGFDDGDEDGAPTDDDAGPTVDDDSGPLLLDDVGPAADTAPLPAELSEESLGRGASLRFICSCRNISSSNCILDITNSVSNM